MTTGERLFRSAHAITAADRSEQADRALGMTLAFVAGAVNAGGFIVVAQYTSHMSGIVSRMADDIALEAFWVAFVGLGALGPFVAGAAVSAILIN